MLCTYTLLPVPVPGQVFRHQVESEKQVKGGEMTEHCIRYQGILRKWVSLKEVVELLFRLFRYVE